MVMFSKASLYLVIVLVNYTRGQSPNCDFTQEILPDITYFVYSPNYPGNYPAGAQCRWMAASPSGYNCKLNCTEINIPQTSSCSMDRLLISKTGDPGLSAADVYCGQGSLLAYSTGQNISIGLISSYSSSGGRFVCQLTAQPIANQCTCGYRKKKNRIVGGQETTPQEFPMMAAIVRLDISQIICGATIIDIRHVLTAAHCLDERNPSSVAVVVGLHDVTGGATSSTKAYNVSRFILHPSYDRAVRDYDIGLILVQGTIEFNMDVGPACLPFKFYNTDFTGNAVTVLGWGLLFPGGPLSNTLQKAELNVVSDSSCRSYIPQATSRQMCTYARGKDACQSDSGGPLLYTDPSNGLLYHVGIVSYGMSCASDYPGVNTRVSALLDWVTATTGAYYCAI